MPIVCPNCATSYEVQASAFGESERQVRCTRCHTVWRAAPPPPEPEMSAAPVNAEGAFAADPLLGAPSPVSFYDTTESATGQAASDEIAPDLPTETDDAHAELASPEGAGRHDDPETGTHTEAGAAAGDAGASAIAIDQAPPLAPDAPDETVSAPNKIITGAPLEDIETFAARRAQHDALQQRYSWLKPSPQTAIIGLLVLVSVLIGWRNDVVRAMPQTASLFSAIGLKVNLRGLSFADVRITTEQHDGMKVLVIEGKIVSEVPKAVAVPRLRFALRNAAGHEVYAWTALPTRPVLQPGKSLPFRSRLASPPPDIRNVLVRFFHRRDIVAGTQ